MTFEELARRAFPDRDLQGEHLKEVTKAMEHGYIAALKSLSWRLGGIEYLGEGRETKRLTDVIEEVRKNNGPL